MHRVPAVVVIVLAWVSVGCSPPQERYELRGTVVSVDLDTGRLSVNHEAIPGLMEAMTMSFRVVDRTMLATLRPDDPVEAVLVVRGRASWLEQLVVVRDDPRDGARAQPSPMSGFLRLALADNIRPHAGAQRAIG